MLDFLIFAIISAVSLICFVIYIYPSKQRKILIPGPSPSDPKEGNLGDIILLNGLNNYLDHLHAGYGDIASFQWGERVVVSIASPELFAQQEQVFDKPGELFHPYLPLLNTSALFLCNGIEGRRKHKAVEMSLNPARLSEIYPAIYEEITRICQNAAEPNMASKTPLDFQSLAEALVFYPLMIIFFGDAAVKEKRHLFAQLKTHFDVLWMEVSLNVKVERNICNRSVREASEKQVRGLLAQLCSPFVLEATGGGESSAASTAAMLMPRSSANMSPSHTAVVEDLMALITVSYPTLTALLVWLVYFIKRHPESVERELIEEMRVDTTTPHDEDVSGDIVAQAKDCFDWLPRMKFLHCCIEETLRLANIVPWTARVLDFESVLGGYRLPAQTPVIQALSVVHQREDIYPQPQKFLPHRFARDSKQPLPVFSFVPFGFAGKRRCPGSKLSYLLVGQIVNHLWSRYDLSMRIEEYPTTGTSRSRGPSTSDQQEPTITPRRSCSECSSEITDSELEDDEENALPTVPCKEGALVPLPDCTFFIKLVPKKSFSSEDE